MNPDSYSKDLDLHTQLRELDNNIMDLKNLSKKGIIIDIDAAINMISEKKQKLIEEKVLSAHPYAITRVNIEKRGKTVVRWQTRCGNQRPRCSTYEAIIEKLFIFYFGTPQVNDYTFETIFELALQNKIDEERPKEKTIRDYRWSYKAFVTEDLSQKDIREITSSELKKYIQQKILELDLTEKRLLKLKGLLNLVFDYAANPERQIILLSPVPKGNKQFKKNCRPTKNRPEDKAFQPDEIELIRNYLWKKVSENEYDVYSYAILFAIETGVREGEIPSLKWSDVTRNSIHIHSQQNDEIRDGKKVYYYNPTTKNEKGYGQDGRYFPMNKKIRQVLDAIKARQEELGIRTEWVFSNRDGEWIKTVMYDKELRKTTRLLGLSLSNNHAFRIALNSYVLIPMGMPVTERAKILGHSVETNLKHYTFSRSDEYIKELSDMWNAYIEKTNVDNNKRGYLGVPQNQQNYFR